ncbi:hypothetical protein F4677DRAFT_431056 [Hypoxylon crocopeplum]|nr:hypothetical protein F4677DRAFT_431056 [Hypoxylon crocopeplum]
MALPFSVPSSLPRAFSMSHSTVADVDAVTEVYYDAFRTDPGNTFWWPPEKDAMVAWMKHRVLRKMGDRSVRHFKVTDTQSGDLVAFTRWDIPEGYATAFGRWIGDDAATVDVSRIITESDSAQQGRGNLPITNAPVEAVMPPTADYPQGARPELCQGFFDALNHMSEKQNAKSMLGLSLLCTSPKYHRRGAAKALMLPMLALADTHGLKVYLEATPNGKPVYEKLGFQEVDWLAFDLKKLTGRLEGMYRLSIMVREPKSVR